MASRKTVIGAPGAHLQPFNYGWSPQRGGWTRRSWHGPKVNVAALAINLRANGYEYEVQETGPNAILTSLIGRTDDGTTEVPTTLWERRVNRIQKSMFQHTAFTTLTQAQRDAIKLAIKNENGATSLAADAAALNFYKVFASGFEDFIVEQPVVIRNQTSSSTYAVTCVMNNVGNILTPAQMLSFESAPGAVLDTKTVSAALAAAPFSCIYGYRKGDPQMTQQAFNRWQVTTEFEAGIWSMYAYTAAS